MKFGIAYGCGNQNRTILYSFDKELFFIGCSTYKHKDAIKSIKNTYKNKEAENYIAKLNEAMSNSIELNENEPDVAPTDSRRRPDQRLMEEGRWDEANQEKLRLEEKQKLIDKYNGINMETIDITTTTRATTSKNKNNKRKTNKRKRSISRRSTKKKSLAEPMTDSWIVVDEED